MTGTARIARALSAAALGFGLLAVAAPTAGADRPEKADRAERAEHVFDCDGSTSSEQAWKTPDRDRRGPPVRPGGQGPRRGGQFRDAGQVGQQS